MRQMWLYVFVSLAFFITAAVCHSCNTDEVDRVAGTAQAPYILIDPGHGGMDGGAIAADGTAEKHINLAVGMDIYDLFVLWGYPVRSTRLTDVSIHDAGAVGTRQIKVSDMRNRLAMYEESDLIISVHQNHFSAEKYYGTQVFYSANDERSVMLAKAVRDSVIGRIQPDNKRELKRATDGIYLLHHTSRPAILVECGFLSNAQERDRLKNASYQQQMAFAVFAGYWEYENLTVEE